MADNRDARALQLRHGGASYRQIQNSIGYRSVTEAREAVQRAIIDDGFEDAEESRLIEAARLDYLTRVLMKVLTTRHYIIAQNGAVVRDPESREPLSDDSIIIQAAAEVRRIGESRRKLLGLDAASKHEITIDQIDQKIEMLEAQLGRDRGQITRE